MTQQNRENTPSYPFSEAWFEVSDTLAPAQNTSETTTDAEGIVSTPTGAPPTAADKVSLLTSQVTETSNQLSNEEQVQPPSPIVQNLPEFSEGKDAVLEQQQLGAQDNDKGNSKNAFSLILQEISLLTNPEEKLRVVLSFIEQTLAQSSTPHFKTFWEARNQCLLLFKENINPLMRSLLWAKYQELSKEAHRLKEIYDEQSQFAAEQIAIAIEALEHDIEHSHAVLEKMATTDLPQLPLLTDKLPWYDQRQKEISLLNVQATRIASLRKELLKTEMRVRTKNKFFQRLSATGDKVFPRRKELIKELSNAFIADVTSFISQYFRTETVHETSFFLRETIKSLQAMAKVLSLNTAAFTHTRKELSICWDQLKSHEKEKKKLLGQKKAEWENNAQLLHQQIDELYGQFLAKTLTTAEGNKRIDEIVSRVHTLDLGRDKLHEIRQKLKEMRQQLLDQMRVEETQKQEQAIEQMQLKKQRISEIRQRLENILQTIERATVEEAIQISEGVSQMLPTLGMTKTEKQELERLLRRLRDATIEKKEQAILSLSEDEAKAFSQIKEVLQQRRQRRQEIKEQIDQLRRASGASGLDFQQAMQYNMQIGAERERLEKADQGIKEIEGRIAAIRHQQP